MGMLDDIKILDFTHVYFGPMATMIMADMGAEVIKIEPPWGEMVRMSADLYGGLSSTFHYLDRNKKDVALNMKDPRALEIIKKLVAECDIIVENFKRGTLDKLGLSYEEAKKINPKVIYASLSGFGLDGPYSSRTSYAPIAESYSGWTKLTADNIEADSKPIVPASYHGDLDPALYAVISILGALRHADKTGKGQLIDVSQLDVMLALNGVQITGFTLSGQLPHVRQANRMPGPRTWGNFMCKDGWVYLAADPQMHGRLMKAMEVDDLGEGSEVLENWLNDLTVQEVVDKVGSVGVPVAHVYNIAEAIEDPHVKARGSIIEYDHPTAGPVRMPGFPVKLSETPATYRLPAPQLGEHTKEVLSEMLGYSDEEIEELRKAGAITLPR
ncbi:CoA transferase [Candidatus Bathyarchaeota archaeon]|nr:CoA transferase [Candidatus Bathyarchaeota archaeon]